MIDISPNGTTSVPFSINDTLSGYTALYAVVVAADAGDYLCINQWQTSLGNGSCTVSGYVRPVAQVGGTPRLRMESLWIKN